MDNGFIIGAPSSVFCYHQCPEVLRQLYLGRTGGLIDDQQGLLIVDELMLDTRLT